MSRPPELVFEDDVQPAAEGPPPRFGELTFEDDVVPQQVAPEVEIGEGGLTFEDDPLAQPEPEVEGGALQTFKTGVAGVAQATLGIAKSILETPRAAARITRSLEEGWNNMGGVAPHLNPYTFARGVFEFLDEGTDVPGTDVHLGGFGGVADMLDSGIKTLPELSPTFRRLGAKGEQADAAARALLDGNTELMKKVATDPEAWAGFLGNGLPSLFAAWKSGGSLPFMGWLEAMDAAQTAQEYERQTGNKMSDEQFATATLAVGATNAFLEKFGLDSILGKLGGEAVEQGAKRGFGSLIGQFVAGTVGEGGTELLQELTNNTAALIYDTELQGRAERAIDEGDWEPFLDEMSRGIVPAAMGGTGLGGTATAARLVLEQLSSRNKTERTRAGDLTPEQEVESGLTEVPITFELLDSETRGRPLTESEQYTIVKNGLGKFANNDEGHVFLVKAGLDKREELRPPPPVGEHIIMEGDEFETMPATVESITDDVDRRVTFSKKDKDRTVRFNKKRMDRGANYAATSDLNEQPQPTDAQIEAGNYRKGHVRVQGLDISIENPKGSVRKGKQWEQTMAHHYGYIRGTVGKDKDHIDTFIGPNAYSQQVYVVNQNNEDGSFDEHKVMLGFTSKDDAEAAYFANYPKGWKGLGSTTAIGMDDFKKWLGSNRTKQPLVERDSREDLQDQEPIIKIREKLPTPSAESRNTMSQQFMEQASQGPFTTKDGREVKLTKVGLKKVRSHAADPKVLAVMPHIGALIEQSMPVRSFSRTSTTPGDSISAYHHYAGKVMLDGKHAFVKVTLRETKDGKVIFYDADVTMGDQMLKKPTQKGFNLQSWWQKDLGITHDDKPKFKTKQEKTNAGAGIQRAELKAAVSLVSRYFRGAPDLEVVEGFEDLPYHIKSRISNEEKGLVTGVYDQDALHETVYLVANNIESYEQGIETLLHEYVGHYGLRSVLGDSYNEMMDRVYERFGTEVREAARVQGLDWTEQESRRVAAEEFIAYTAQRYLNKKPLTKKAQELLRQFIEEIKRLWALAWGKPTTMTERDLAQLIARAFDYVHNPGGYARTQRRGLRRHMENPVFFSNLFKFINDLPAKSMSPDEWLKQIGTEAVTEMGDDKKQKVVKAGTGAVGMGKIKEEELQWSNLREAIGDASWGEVVRVLAQSAFPLDNLVPKEIVDAWRNFGDAESRFVIVEKEMEDLTRDAGRSVWSDENHPRWKEGQEIHKRMKEAEVADKAAQEVWQQFENQKPKKMPKEFVLAHIQANGTEVYITKNGSGEEEEEMPSFDFDEDHPDESEGSSDDDAAMEAYSEYQSNNWDEDLFKEAMVEQLKYGRHSSYDWKKANTIHEGDDESTPAYDDSLEDLSDNELYDLAEEFYQRGGDLETEWEKMRDAAMDSYYEAYDNQHYHDFMSNYESENRKETWFVGDYVVYRTGGTFEVHNNETGSYIGDYRQQWRATEAMESDWRENNDSDGGKRTRWKQYTLDGSREYEEWLIRWKNPSTTLYTTEVHWGDTENILAHARFDVRKDRDGNDAIFIDEMQSDWHQDLRDEGEKLSEAQIKRLERELANYRSDYRRLIPDLYREMRTWKLDVKTFSKMQTENGPLREYARDLLGNLREQLSREQTTIDNHREDYQDGVRAQVYKRHGWDTNENEDGNRAYGAWDGTSLEDMEIETRQIIDDNPFDPMMETVEVETFTPNFTTRVLRPRSVLTWNQFLDRLEELDTHDLSSELPRGNSSTPMRLGAIYASIAPILKAQTEGIDERWGDLADILPEERRQGIGIQRPLTSMTVTEGYVEERAKEINAMALELREREGALEKGKKGVHPAPFGKTWQLLVMKTMIREAVDRGYKTVFMAPGEIHGVRWSGAITVDGVQWNVTTMEQVKKGKDGKPIPLAQTDPRYVAGEVVYEFEEVPAVSITPISYDSNKGSAAKFVPMGKLSSVVGLDVAALINDSIKNNVMNGHIGAAKVGRDMLFLPNTRDTLSGGREIYNVITPNLINKFLKKFGAEMKLGFVSDQHKSVREESGVKRLKITPEQSREGITVRALTLEESKALITDVGIDPDKVGDESAGWWAAFRPDGIVYTDSVNLGRDMVERWVRKEEDKISIHGFEAWEIKITDKLAEAAKGGFPLFMKKYPSKKLNDAMQWADKNVGPRGPSGVEKMQRRVNNVISISNKAAKLEQAFVDQFAGIKHALLEAYGEELPAERSGYKQAHFSTGVDSQIYAFMTHGVPTWKNGITAIKEGSKGFLEILEPVAAHIDEYYLWRAAARAKRLMKEGREHLFGEDEIEGLLELSNYHPEFIEVAVEEAKWRGEFLDWAQEAGAIDPTTRQLWDNADYVPFFRLKADELGGSFTATSGVGGRGIVDQYNPIKRLKGGSQPLGNLLENVIMNFTHIAATTMKNRAAALTIDSLMDTDLIEPVKGSEFLQKERIDMGDLKRKLKAAGVDWKALDEDALYAMRQMWTVQPPQGDDIVSILVGGKKKYYHVKDELLFRSLTAINASAFNSTFAKIMMAPFRGTKRFVTSMITLAADFIAANVVRDTMSSFVVSRHANWPRFDRNLKGAYTAFVEGKEMVDMMATGAAMYAGYVNALDPAATSRAIKRSIRKAGFSRTLLNTPRKLLDVYLRLGSASENASRIGMAYIPAKKAGTSDAEAAWQALDLMNFRKHGDNAVLQFFIQTVPFMNARIQGLVRAGQRFKEAPGITAVKGMLLLAATLALWFRNKDDERYKELPDEDKDLYFHFWIGDTHYRLPKPFEVGMIFATAPERIMEYWLSNEDDAGKLALNRLSFVFDQVFMLFDPTTIVPMPALVEPLVEVNLNQNFFFKAPIVPEYMQDIGLVKPEQVYDDTTSPLMREVAKYSPDFLPNNLRNPMMLEHLATSYGGTLTSYAVMMADDLVRQAYDYPPRPKLMWSQMPVAGRFYRGTEPPRRTGYENILYEVRQNARAIDRAITQMEDRELQDEADAFLTERSAYNSRVTNEEVLDAARDMEPNYNEIRRIRKEMSEIWADENMSPQQKLDQLNQLYRDKAAEARDAYEQRPGAGQGDEIGPIIQLNQIIDNIKGLTPNEAVEKLIADDKPATADLVASLPRVTSQSFSKALDDA